MSLYRRVMSAPREGTPFQAPVEPENSQANQQTVINMSHVEDGADVTTARSGGEQNGDGQNADQNDTPAWRLNIELNPDLLGQARNISQDDVTSLTNTLRQLYQQMGVVYFVQESNFLNFFMLFMALFSMIFLRTFMNSIDLIVLGMFRFTHYVDAFKFKMKNDLTRMGLTKFLINIAIRNIAAYVFFDHSAYFKVLSYTPVITDSFIYVMFVIAMANMMIYDAILLAKILLAYVPWIQMRQKREFVKVVEHFLFLYISSLPVIQWVTFVGNAWLVVLYAILKVVIYAHLICRAFAVFFQFVRTTKIGKPPASHELIGYICPICHCEPEKPLKIACGHIFDEQCLKEWLEIKNECPMCREIVVPKHTNYPHMSICPPYIF